jgi:hypothetical protein
MDSRLEQFTNARMLSTLAASEQRPFESSVDDLFAAVRGWCAPNGPRDDVSILGISTVDEPS